MIFETWARKRKIDNMFLYDHINTFYDEYMTHTMVDRVDKNKYSEVMVLQKEKPIDEGRLVFYRELEKPKVYNKRK